MKRFESGCDENWEGQIIGISLNGNFGEFRPFL